jgi:hypothetical protein
MERLVWTSMLFPGYRPAVFDDIPITAIITMEAEGMVPDAGRPPDAREHSPVPTNVRWDARRRPGS